MKFMLMMHTPRGTGDYAIYKWKPEAFKAHIDFMKNLNKDLRADGVLVGAEGLTPPSEARIVKAGKGSTPDVTDGPFAESKEFLAGFWMIDVESPEQAYAIAGRASSAPGPDGEPMHIAIEVRRVMDGPPPTE
jgi:hypothetical protein